LTIRRLDPSVSPSIQETQNEVQGAGVSASPPETNLGIGSTQDTYESYNAPFIDSQLAPVENQIESLLNEIEGKQAQEEAVKDRVESGDEQKKMDDLLRNALFKAKFFP